MQSEYEMWCDERAKVAARQGKRRPMVTGLDAVVFVVGMVVLLAVALWPR